VKSSVIREGQVVEFNEKPSVSGGRVSGGFFVCRKEIFDIWIRRDDLVFELEPMSQLAKDRQLGLYEHNGFWQPMDTYRDYAALNALVSGGNAPGCCGNDLLPLSDYFVARGSSLLATRVSRDRGCLCGCISSAPTWWDTPFLPAEGAKSFSTFEAR
jgi:hypothetical protein